MRNGKTVKSKTVKPGEFCLYDGCRERMRRMPANCLTVSMFVKGRVLHCKTRPFSVPLTAFRNAFCRILGSSAVLVYAITALPIAFAIAFHVYILPQARRSVTVMPHLDAASSACSLFRLAYRVFSGCRIKVRHDGYRLPGLK